MSVRVASLEYTKKTIPFSGRTEFQTLEESKRRAKIERSFSRWGNSVWYLIIIAHKYCIFPRLYYCISTITVIYLFLFFLNNLFLQVVCLLYSLEPYFFCLLSLNYVSLYFCNKLFIIYFMHDQLLFSILNTHLSSYKILVS